MPVEHVHLVLRHRFLHT